MYISTNKVVCDHVGLYISLIDIFITISIDPIIHISQPYRLSVTTCLRNLSYDALCNKMSLLDIDTLT